jgi:hypothetical protein
MCDKRKSLTVQIEKCCALIIEILIILPSRFQSLLHDFNKLNLLNNSMNASKFLNTCEQVLHGDPHLSGDSLHLNNDRFDIWAMERGLGKAGGKGGRLKRGRRGGTRGGLRWE